MGLHSPPLPDALENRLKLRHYTLLIALAHHRSITRVAEAWGNSQPTVTRALADVEEIFGMPLFFRTGRGLQPTVAGSLVIARARQAVAEAEALVHELEGVRVGRQGRLRLGVLPYASDRVLDLTWGHLLAYQPRFTVQSVEELTGSLLRDLRERSLDCAICRFSQAEGDADIQQVLLYQQQPRLVVAQPSAMRLSRLLHSDIAQLSDMDWIFPPADTPIRQVIEALFSSAGKRAPVPLLEAYAVRTIVSALRRLPRGVTVLPDDIAQAVAHSGAGEVMPQALPWSLPPVGLAWLRGSPKKAIITGLRDAILAGLGPVPIVGDLTG